jgi:intracellular multiplication protein IcmL
MKDVVKVHGVERVTHRNQFYWGSYRYIALCVAILLFLNVLLIGFIIYQRITWPKPKYFATTTDGRPIPVVNLTLPYYSDPTVVLDWATQAIQAIYSLDYVTWRKVLQDAEAYFTTKGYMDFIRALKASTNLNAVKADKYIVSVVITGKPVLTRQGQRTPDVPYSWSLQIPVTVNYQNSSNKTISQVGVMQIDVERASLLRHEVGIAIAQLVFIQNS